MELELPWTEKYRPKMLEEVAGNREVVERLKVFAQKKEMPNMLFAGPAGTGKTTCAIAFSREIFGNFFNQNFLELNASDERGIDVVRGKIKDFAAIIPYSDVKFKIILLDEADSMTPDAQNALRRTMERYSGTCRFILSANYSSKIIEPIQSRCALFRFRALDEAEVCTRLSNIAEKEGLKLTKGGLKALFYSSGGDLRRAINLMQSTAISSKDITEDSVFRVAARAKPREIREMLTLAMKGDFENSRRMLDKLLYEYGMSGEDMITQIFHEAIDMEIDQEKKVKLVDKIGEYNFRLTEGANERIQLEALLAYFVLLGSE